MVSTLVGAIPVLTALDVNSNLKFWGSTLGFSITHAGEGFAIVARDDVVLHISAVESQEVPDNTQAWIRVREVDGLFREWSAAVPVGFEKAGAALTEILDNPWGREFALRDPAGNCVHFVEEG
ncbi:VOC family protein [Nocardia sp. NPDC047038]|uniref:bleomycin resistance protein n=1 Tax=Nocardia sp. NPDC047038 TaxID=3154338 RepID=UPI0033DEB743